MKEVANDPSPLPRLPLGGNIRLLFIDLRDSLIGLKTISALPTRLQEISAGLSKQSSLVYFFQVTHVILKKSLSDSFGRFRIYKDEGKIKIDQDNDVDAFEAFYRIYRDLETKENTKSHTFNLASLFGRKTSNLENQNFIFGCNPPVCQEFLQSNSLWQSTEDADKEVDGDMNAFSRKSDERDASIAIQKFIRHRKIINISALHFYHWKETLLSFVLLISAKIKIRKLRAQIAEGAKNQIQVCYPLTSFPNLWRDLRVVEESKMNWKKIVENGMPFFDGAECEFCGVPFNMRICQDRQNWWRSNYPNLPYKVAAIQFNLTHFKTQCWMSPFFSAHQQMPQHRAASELVSNLVNELPKIFGRFDISIKMLEDTVRVCQEEADKGGAFTSWYLNCREDSASLNTEMKYRLDQMCRLYFGRKLDELQSLMRYFVDTSLRAQTYLTGKQEEEKQMKEEQMVNLQDETKEFCEEEDDDGFVMDLRI